MRLIHPVLGECPQSGQDRWKQPLAHGGLYTIVVPDRYRGGTRPPPGREMETLVLVRVKKMAGVAPWHGSLPKVGRGGTRPYQFGYGSFTVCNGSAESGQFLFVWPK